MTEIILIAAQFVLGPCCKSIYFMQLASSPFLLVRRTLHGKPAINTAFDARLRPCDVVKQGDCERLAGLTNPISSFQVCEARRPGFFGHKSETPEGSKHLAKSATKNRLQEGTELRLTRLFVAHTNFCHRAQLWATQTVKLTLFTCLQHVSTDDLSNVFLLLKHNSSII